MAFLDNHNPPETASSVAALRNIDVTGYSASNTVIVTDSGRRVLMRFSPQSAGPENLEAGVVKPASKGDNDLGRWVYVSLS